MFAGKLSAGKTFMGKGVAIL